MDSESKSLRILFIMGTTAATIVVGILSYLCFYLSTDKEVLVLNFSTLLLGVAIGWLLGILLSPFDIGEKKDFSVYAKVFSAFVSGYVVAKIDKIVEKLLSTDYLFQTIPTFRGMVLVTSTIISMIIVFSFRKYFK